MGYAHVLPEPDFSPCELPNEALMIDISPPLRLVVSRGKMPVNHRYFIVHGKQTRGYNWRASSSWNKFTLLGIMV